VSYREHPPPRDLVPWLACTWERQGDGSSSVRVLPDGCIDIVFSPAGTQIAGPNIQAFLVAIAPGERYVGARLRPGCAPALLGLAAESVRDALPPIEDVLGDPGARLDDALRCAVDPRERLVDWLLAQATRAPRPDPLVAAAVGRLERRSDDVAGLARELSVSGRDLRRKMTGTIGYGPKRLARVLRLGRALEAIRRGQEPARAALDAGYADQTHFSADCRSLAGVPPSRLLASG
jgi:AraC-like DNA-binding protein